MSPRVRQDRAIGLSVYCSFSLPHFSLQRHLGRAVWLSYDLSFLVSTVERLGAPPPPAPGVSFQPQPHSPAALGFRRAEQNGDVINRAAGRGSSHTALPCWGGAGGGALWAGESCSSVPRLHSLQPAAHYFMRPARSWAHRAICRKTRFCLQGRVLCTRSSLCP